ncbi:hypothetical protein ACFLZV_06835 [Candidatus Margulisiibacteriota bacterium]
MIFKKIISTKKAKKKKPDMNTTIYMKGGKVTHKEWYPEVKMIKCDQNDLRTKIQITMENKLRINSIGIDQYASAHQFNNQKETDLKSRIKIYTPTKKKKKKKHFLTVYSKLTFKILTKEEFFKKGKNFRYIRLGTKGQPQKLVNLIKQADYMNSLGYPSLRKIIVIELYPDPNGVNVCFCEEDLQTDLFAHRQSLERKDKKKLKDAFSKNIDELINMYNEYRRDVRISQSLKFDLLHTAIKPENIFIYSIQEKNKQTTKFKLGNLIHCKSKEETQGILENKNQKSINIDYYLYPFYGEVLKKYPQKLSLIENWAFGIVLYEFIHNNKLPNVLKCNHSNTIFPHNDSSGTNKILKKLEELTKSLVDERTIRGIQAEGFLCPAPILDNQSTLKLIKRN